MFLDVVYDKESVTAPAVTLTLDPETCFALASVLTELGTALGRAERSFNARKRWEAGAPQREAQKEAFTACVARRIAVLKPRPRREIVSIIGKEFEIGYDMATFYYRDIMQEERHRAALEREENIARMRKEGIKARVIAERLKLSRGHVRNILSRMRANTSSPGEAAAPTAS